MFSVDRMCQVSMPYSCTMEWAFRWSLPRCWVLLKWLRLCALATSNMLQEFMLLRKDLGGNHILWACRLHLCQHWTMEWIWQMAVNVSMQAQNHCNSSMFLNQPVNASCPRAAPLFSLAFDNGSWMSASSSDRKIECRKCCEIVRGGFDEAITIGCVSWRLLFERGVYYCCTTEYDFVWSLLCIEFDHDSWMSIELPCLSSCLQMFSNSFLILQLFLRFWFCKTVQQTCRSMLCEVGNCIFPHL